MPVLQSDFDVACHKFTSAMSLASRWKHSYLGAAYTTRLQQACKDAKAAIEEMENVIRKETEK